jgi:hypothetical protein
MGQDLPTGQGGRQWSSPELRSTVEAVDQSGAGSFAGGGAAGSPAVVMIPTGVEGDRGGELHAATEGKRESLSGGGYQWSNEERR